LDGLRGLADKDNDNIVTFKELKNYVSDKVSELTEGKQRPQGSASDVAANYIPIALVNTVDSAGAGDYGTLVIRTPDLDGVNVSVDGKAVGTLNSRLQNTVKVKAGDRSLSFTKDGVTRNIVAKVDPGKSKLVEVNLSFSESDEQSLIDSANNQVNVFLREDKEPSKEAKKLFLDGVDSFNKQRFPEAIGILDKAVQANNGAYADAWVYLGRAHQANGDEAAAVKSFRTALNLRPTDFETKTLLAEARFNIGDNIQEIITDLRDVIKRHPNFDFARVVLGDVFFYRGDVISAELQLRAAIRANPNSPPAHMILADILSEQDSLEKRKEAPKEAQKAIELFNKVAEKQVSVAKGLKSLSLSHILFGGARYENKRALAEANYILGKALTNLVEYAINNAESLPESGTDLEQGRKALADSMAMAQKAKDNKRVVAVLMTSSLNNLMREDVNGAIKDGEDALKQGKGIFAAKDMCYVNFTLANAYSAAQKYPKAAENLKTYLDSCGADLAADRRDALREELVKLQKDPNRKK
jgi:tetratricopeptide (TPR) repeat protein